MIPSSQKIKTKEFFSCLRTPGQNGRRMRSNSRHLAKILLEDSSLKGVTSKQRLNSYLGHDDKNT